MASHHNQTESGTRRTIRRFFLSAFVVISFALYALHKPSTAAGTIPGAASNDNNLASQGLTTGNQPDQSSQGASSAQAQAPQQPAPTGPSTAAAAPTVAPQQPTPTTPAPTTTAAVASGQYKNGTFTGPQVDAFYGIVQVQADVQNGKLANVQFLQYPNDRRTSVQINSIAIPYLQQEAIQAQSANVDIITGATLTSQAFAYSLQQALSQAQK